MAIYLDGLRRCDNCHMELGTRLAVPCSGEIAFKCRKAELCLGCANKHNGYCQDCVETEKTWLLIDEFMDSESMLDYTTAEEKRDHAHELRMLDQWNKMAQA